MTEPQNVPMFDVDAVVPLKRIAPKTDKPRWAKCRVLTRCDDCLLVLAQTEGRGPFPRQARWKRMANGIDRFLCHEHARHWRDAEGKDILQGMQGGTA